MAVRVAAPATRVEAPPRADCDAIAIDYVSTALSLTGSGAHTRGSRCGPHADVLGWQPEVPLAAVDQQTCLCALSTYLDDWMRYAAQLQHRVRPGGRLFALFAQPRRDYTTAGFIEGPPYDGDILDARSTWLRQLCLADGSE